MMEIGAIHADRKLGKVTAPHHFRLAAGREMVQVWTLRTAFAGFPLSQTAAKIPPITWIAERLSGPMFEARQQKRLK